MSRPRSADAPAQGLHRRSVLTAAGAVTLAAGVGLSLRPAESSAAPRAAAPPAPAPAARTTAPAPLAPYTRGTTLATVATPRGSAAYRTLGEGPGWPRVVRDELAAPRAGRSARRATLAAFVQVTDLHLTDVQHPRRMEFLRAATPRGWRPQEALTVPGAVSLVERINSLRGGPVTGNPLQFVMTTGDNTDNNSRLELDWFLKVMSGGRITPDSGDPGHYEGVQNSGLSLYWQPGSAARDQDKALGFPRLPAFLSAAVREVRSPGLDMPWYSTVGNHDALPGGGFGARPDPYLAEVSVGGRKLMDATPAEARALKRAFESGQDLAGTGYRDFLKAHARSARRVTPDERRAPFTPAEYLRAHLDPAHQGHGPLGHGYTADNLAAGTRYYTFRISDDVIGVSLDTIDPAGHYQGSVGTAQLRWLERTLKQHADSHAIVFSHHTGASMTNTRPDPDRPAEARHDGAGLISVLGAHRNVLAWVNGHVHQNIVTPHRSPSGGGFWEISTASHLDHPQLARVIELVDNADGTLSLFTTLVESAAPYRADRSDLSPSGLAALYRELALNAPDALTTLAGQPADRNTELLLAKR
ncbi:metallophosphoesterase (TIGR03767 family) [Streptomyces sp. BK022]|uniref:TIGR03767 family metallophosphoesterase n=1 Tax=Streptomyces sp. BK022 TaxID=2512123 RepID=UPI001028C983|nr:TIGR03767 family metallophosphoesterase [Streptomyces sp. BK022]RZU37442.1 metallophosphoesterase (TIGR03767 family) [Streptomyces sp. BK022]